jgi:hypothetical protein
MAEPQPGGAIVVRTEATVPAPGVARRTGRGHVVSFGDGRICAVPGCATRLSRYNSGARCSARHHEPSAPRVR